jgi:hypothetical protein
MNKTEKNQTAYQYDSVSSSIITTHNYGWADAINRMVDQRYAFLDLQYESEAYLFRGMSSGLFHALSDDWFWHYAAQDRGGNLEKELGIIFVSQDFSDAYTISKLWKKKIDACILVFKSDVFNHALDEKEAAMMATAEPGVVFKYPLLTQALTISDIDYFILPSELIDRVQDEELELFPEMENLDSAYLKSLILELHKAGKVLISDANSLDGNSERSVLENYLNKKLLERNILGAKTIPASCKPTRKI